MINANHRCEVAPESLAFRRNLLSKISTSFPNVFLEGTPVFKMSQLDLFCFLGNYLLPSLKCNEEPFLCIQCFLSGPSLLDHPHLYNSPLFLVSAASKALKS